MKRKKIHSFVRKALSVGLFAVVLLAAGCDNGGNEEETLWLKDLANPFIGEWKSDAADDGTTLTLTGSSDGAFQYKMEGVPKEMGLPETGRGAYIIKDNIIISYFDFGMIKSNLFEVIDNDTIMTTGFTLNETGQKVPDEAIHFRRAGEAVSKENQPIVLPENIFAGKKWSAHIPEPEIPGYAYQSTWEFKRDGTVICTFIGLGEALGFASEDAPYTFGYVILDAKLVVFTESAEGNEIKVFEFARQNAAIVNVTEMILVNNFVAQAGGVTIPYTLLQE